MNIVNYHETIIIPTLQKKINDLQSTNLFLEISLLVEQAKNKDITSFFQKELEKVNLNENDILHLKQRLKETEDNLNEKDQKLKSTDHELNRERSLKNNILSEYNNLKQNYDSLIEEKNKLSLEHEEFKKKTESKRKQVQSVA